VQTPGGGEFQALADCQKHDSANTRQDIPQLIVIPSAVEGSRGITVGFAPGFLDFAALRSE
jgi:hypothetical protein